MQFYRQKLKEFKTWAQIKSPQLIRPALSYTLGWLSPELLGTGFRMVEISDFSMKATVPAESSNLDSNHELHQGLILNASIELSKTFINRHLTETYYQIDSTEIKISKKQKWSKDLNLYLQVKDVTLDDFFSELQQNKKAQLLLSIRLGLETTKKTDSVELKLNCSPINLLTAKV